MNTSAQTRLRRRYPPHRVRFGWLWTAYAVSASGTWLGFGAFPLIAILVLHAGPAEVSVPSSS